MREARQVSSSVDQGIAETRAIEAARRGDPAAFNQLVLAYQTTAYNVALRTLGNPDDAADAAQDAFLSAYRAISDFRGGSFKSWLLRIVVNTCYDLLRRRQRRPSSSLDELVEETGESPAVADRKIGPERAALASETAQAIEHALALLPDDQRLIVVLCDVQGQSYEEAAEITGVALGTVKSRLSRARARLRHLLTERGELPAALERHDG
ncbi:MAG: sigma-70 family RNA polymerase sigma factor [Chloroflexi bacterium]|nr:sigma-70 family RNA polymerase sigma factor [Chloroflexota bacterium]